MSERSVEHTPGIPDRTINLDVLIVGGGIVGLWLLNDLRRDGYAALLLERRELGGEQTCHSHVYIHHGHLYRDLALAERLRDTVALWRLWLEKNAVERAVMPSCFGFRNPADAQARRSMWEDRRLRLPFINVAAGAVPALRDGTIREVLQTPEIALDGTSLVSCLSRNISHHISRVDRVGHIEVSRSAKAVELVEAHMPRGERLWFRPKALVLAAGAGNRALLEEATAEDNGLRARARKLQQVRRSHMLVVQGSREDLIPLTGVFPSYDGLFLVSRELGGETVWLVSNHVGPEATCVEEWLNHDERRWLPPVWASLLEVAPLCFRHPERLRWGVYAAPKAEGRHRGIVPSEERIERCGLVNLWAVWPTKLTLAPTASRKVTDEVRRLIPHSTPWASLPPAWSGARVPAETAVERWRKTPLVSWDEFRTCYNLWEHTL